MCIYIQHRSITLLIKPLYKSLRRIFEESRTDRPVSLVFGLAASQLIIRVCLFLASSSGLRAVRLHQDKKKHAALRLLRCAAR